MKSHDQINSPKELLVSMLFHFNILTEYQLMDLQSMARTSVKRILTSVEELDKMIAEDGDVTRDLYESLFALSEEDGGRTAELNESSDQRVERIMQEALGELNGDLGERIKNSPDFDIFKEAQDLIWSKISKQLEALCQVEGKLKEKIFTIVECLNFEDIQSQRLDHIIKSLKSLNSNLTSMIYHGIENETIETVKKFEREFITSTKQDYTTPEERKIFDQVYILCDTSYTKKKIKDAI